MQTDLGRPVFYDLYSPSALFGNAPEYHYCGGTVGKHECDICNEYRITGHRYREIYPTIPLYPLPVTWSERGCKLQYV